jgi:two-component system, NarL family, response regulator NreC
MADRLPPYRVLLADDAASVRQGLRWLLENEPELLVIGEAATGLETVRQTVALQPDVVILDIEMPAMDGFEVARSLKALPAPPLIFFLSVHTDPAVHAQAFASGADGFIEKSAAGMALLLALKEIL